MKRFLIGVLSMPLFFALGVFGGAAIESPGTYAAFKSSASVSGELTLYIPPPQYAIPAECGDIDDYVNVVLMEELGTNSYTGGNTSDVIFGTDGPDTIFGGTGNDCIIAGGGNDFVIAIWGFDYIFGGDGADTLIGDGTVANPGSYIDGGPGNDFCTPAAVSHNCAQSSPVSLTAEGHHSIPTIDLDWQAVWGADSYNVYRAEASTGPYLLMGSSSTASYSDVGVAEDKVYFYRVTAVFQGVESDASPIGAVSVPSGTVTPTATIQASPTATVQAPTSTPMPTLSPTSTPTMAPTATSTPTPTATVGP